MSIIRSSQYPGRWNTPDADSPQGSGKNRTAPGSNDGSYFDQAWFNDMDSLHQALFIASGVSPNGVQDVGTASQIFDALINNRWSGIGNYLVGTIVTGSDGNQYKAVANNGRDTTVLDPVSATDRSVWVKYPYEDGSNSNGEYRIHHDGSIEQWGFTTQSVSGIASVIFPINFTGNPSDIHITFGDSSSTGNVVGVSSFGVGGTPTLSGFQALSVNVTTSSPSVGDAAYYYAYSRG